MIRLGKPGFALAAMTVASLVGGPNVFTAAAQEGPAIVQPGAPGEDTRTLSAEDAIAVTDTSFSPDDVRFMQAMIPHHFQAVQMAALVEERTNNQAILNLAGRIDATQADEIAFMQTWLRNRGQHAPDPAAAMGEPMSHDGHGGDAMESEHDGHDGEGDMFMSHEAMGMASPEEMAALAEAEGTDFDRLFLELMIPHHQGAVKMVKVLEEKPGSAFDPVLYEFTNDIVNDQLAEIERMNALLAGLTEDPRAGLQGGVMDAGTAISNLRHVAHLPKPDGFFDPNNPEALPPEPESTEPGMMDSLGTMISGMLGAQGDSGEAGDGLGEGPVPESIAQQERRWAFLSFANTDMAFSGNRLFVGNYHGFNIYELDGEGVPALITSVVCPGGQGDVSVMGDLLIMSVEETRARVDCGLEGIDADVSEERFRGLRIFDISDVRNPRQVGQVQTCRGSHTHSIVAGPDAKGKLIVYNSGISTIREEEELPGCVEGEPGDDRTALFRIDVVEIPVDDPARARIVKSPAVFADPETGRLAGLWTGGDHGEGTQETRRTDHCHDITVFPDAGIAAGACSGNGIIFDISDPMNPERIDAETDPGFAYWHSATLNNDGDKVVFTDEWGGGVRARCRAADPMDWGANALFTVDDGELSFASYYKIAGVQADTENCVAHNGSIVPVPGRDLFAQAWYQGGLSIMDFTETDNPKEIAFFDRGPVNEEALTLGGYWSVYWYQGRLYGTEIIRGLDVFALEPSAHLSEHEIAAAQVAQVGKTFNPQTQTKVTWPAEPVVAHAYLDQLARQDWAPVMAGELRDLLDQAEAQLAAGSADADLSEALRSQADTLQAMEASGQTGKRLTGLASVLEGLSQRLAG